MELTDAIQDYVKEIYKLEASGSRVTTSALAARLGVSPPSSRDGEEARPLGGLVEHQRYRGALLTRKGERVALEVIRHHRLLEQYLSQTLGLPIDAARRSRPPRARAVGGARGAHRP